MSRSDIRVRKTPNGRHLYVANKTACGYYGRGNTPAEARAKFIENETAYLSQQGQKR